jgi:hypothetical protein
VDNMENAMNMMGNANAHQDTEASIV